MFYYLVFFEGALLFSLYYIYWPTTLLESHVHRNMVSHSLPYMLQPTIHFLTLITHSRCVRHAPPMHTTQDAAPFGAGFMGFPSMPTPAPEKIVEFQEAQRWVLPV